MLGRRPGTGEAGGGRGDSSPPRARADTGGAGALRSPADRGRARQRAVPVEHDHEVVLADGSSAVASWSMLRPRASTSACR